MRVRMYNCGFGDCFQIDDDTINSKIPEKSSLLIDYGWAKKIEDKYKQNYSEILNEIKKDNESKKDISFLLTHYHEDHYCGLFNSRDNGKEKIHFKHIYIPDVWDADSNVKLIALLLISDLKRKSRWSLIDFLLEIIETDGICHFVSQDSEIEGRYKALWPNKEVVSSTADKDFDSLYNKDVYNVFVNELLNLSRDLISVVSEWKDKSFSEIDKDMTRKNLEQIKGLQNDLRHSKEIYGEKNKRIYLTSYANIVSIVFQTKKELDNIIPKVLFTGDFPEKYWREIEKDLLNEYDYIKIPHHGTSKYYWLNLNEHIKENTKILIPNGTIKDDSWFIYYKYAENLNTGNKKYQIVCADNKACPVSLGSGHKCICKNGSGCIATDRYKDFTSN